jgi:hypothetical protein
VAKPKAKLPSLAADLPTAYSKSKKFAATNPDVLAKQIISPLSPVLEAEEGGRGGGGTGCVVAPGKLEWKKLILDLNAVG